VRLADLLNVTYGAEDRGKAHARISIKCIDFVICNAEMRPLIAFDLRDGTVDKDYRTRSAWIATVLAKVSLPLERFDVKECYSLDEVRTRLAKHLRPHAMVRRAAVQAVA
jgi:hypothetical protein